MLPTSLAGVRASDERIPPLSLRLGHVWMGDWYHLEIVDAGEVVGVHREQGEPVRERGGCDEGVVGTGRWFSTGSA